VRNLSTKLYRIYVCYTNITLYTVGPHFTMGLCSWIFGCKSNRRKTSII